MNGEAAIATAIITLAGLALLGSMVWYSLFRERGHGWYARQVRGEAKRYAQQVAAWELIESKYPGQFAVHPRAYPPKCTTCGVHVRHPEFATHAAWHDSLKLEIGDPR